LAPVQVGSLATLHSRGDRPDADLFILDECHHAGARSIRAILESYPKAHILGLTATPSRSDGKPLDMFEQLVCGPTTKELIAIGAVVPCEMYAPVSETDSHILAMDPMLARLKYGYGRRTIIFADSVGHAKLLVEQFDDLASLMIGDTSREDRVTARTLMKSGRRPVLIGYGVFLEGFDCPETELIILARKFNTTSAFLQAIGRGVRSSPGKTKCRAIDLCGSVLQHGLFEDDRKWSLEGDAVQRLDVPRLGRCVACGAIFPPMSICPRCGASSRSVKKVKLPRTRAQALEELSALSPKERDERYMKGFRRAAEKRGANPEWWARKKFVEKFHREPMK
jgi:superfamily II DNA or RNA helicase